MPDGWDHHRHGKRHQHDADYDDQGVRRNHAAKRVAACEYADDEQHEHCAAIIHGHDGAHDRGGGRIAVAAFAQELQVHECGSDAGGHGHHRESLRDL